MIACDSKSGRIPGHPAESGTGAVFGVAQFGPANRLECSVVSRGLWPTISGVATILGAIPFLSVSRHGGLHVSSGKSEKCGRE